MSESRKNPEAVSELLSEEELNRQLAQMAEETPEMPEDFHTRWTEQIRAEAGRKPAEKTAERRRQWRYILSAAAAFIFLIGGTLLTRNHGKVNNTYAAERKESVTAAGYEDAGAAGAANGSAAAGAAINPGIKADRTAETEMAEAEEAFDEVFEAAPMEAPALNAFLGNAADTAEEPAMEDAAMGEYAEAAYDTDMEEAAEPAEEEEPEAGAETEETEAEKAGSGTAEPEEEKAESGFTGFLKDLGIFTLKTLAVAAAGAALALLAAAIGRKARKNKS